MEINYYNYLNLLNKEQKKTVEKAIAAAEAAFPEWRNTPAVKRARIMFRFKELL